MAKAKQKETVTTKQNSILENLKKFNIKSILIVAVILMAFVIGRLTQKVEDLTGVSATTNTTATTTGTGTAGTTTPTVSLDTIKGLWDKNIIKLGNANSKLLFVEVVDPSCPYCHAAGGYDPEVGQQMGTQFTYSANGGSYQPPASEMENLVKQGKASMAFVYYPGHGDGEVGMTALYCANEQSKFWQVNNLLMSNAGYNLMNNTKIKFNPTQTDITNGFRAYQPQDATTMANFLKSAVDTNFMTSCINSKKYVSQLTDDTNLATSLGVTGTPGFFVNSTLYPGAYSWTDMQSTVNSALK